MYTAHLFRWQARGSADTQLRACRWQVLFEQDQNLGGRLYHADFTGDGHAWQGELSKPKPFIRFRRSIGRDQKCRAHAVAAESSRLKKNQSDARFSVQPACSITNQYSDSESHKSDTHIS